MPPDIVNTPAIATVYPTATSSAVDDAGPRPERGLDIGDEASRGGLGPRELGHGEREQDDGHCRRDDRQRGRDAGGDGDHAEGEVEVDPGSDVRDRRGGQVRRAQLPGPQLLWALAHRALSLGGQSATDARRRLDRLTRERVRGRLPENRLRPATCRRRANCGHVPTVRPDRRSRAGERRNLAAGRSGQPESPRAIATPTGPDWGSSTLEGRRDRPQGADRGVHRHRLRLRGAQ